MFIIFIIFIIIKKIQYFVFIDPLNIASTDLHDNIDPEFDLNPLEIDNDENTQNIINDPANPVTDNNATDDIKIADNPPNSNDTTATNTDLAREQSPLGYVVEGYMMGISVIRHSGYYVDGRYIGPCWKQTIREYSFCSACHKIVTSDAAFHRHAKRVHTENTFECAVCHRRFHSRSERENHHRSKHVPAAEKPYECRSCHKRFGRRSVLVRHIRNRTCGPLKNCRSEQIDALINDIV